MDDLGKILSANIKAERARCNLTQEQVSEKLGITKRTYIKYEQNALKLPSSILIKLAEIFNCEIAAFFIKF